MLYPLFFPLADQLQAFNLFRYITFRSGGAAVTALLISFLFGPHIIAWLRAKQANGQPIRPDGPDGHLARKKGTPTMGGFLILLALTISTLLWADLANAYVWIVLLVTVGFGLIGFFDDYRKIRRNSHYGLSGRTKLGLEILLSALACIAVTYVTPPGLANALAVPFFKNVLFELGWFFVPFGVLVIIGASNAVNLTDGLDGLAIVPSMIAAGCFAFIAYLVGNSIFANYLQIHHVSGAGELTVFCGAMVGASLGFLWFNAPPAMVFMGDTGSLSIGSRDDQRGYETRACARDRRRAVCSGGDLGHRSGRELQDDGTPSIPNGPAPPSLRAKRLGRTDDCHSVLDHRLDPGDRRACHFEIALN
jgi:phospho-N-acetylmuramoyl-pentapeptide-transferase